MSHENKISWKKAVVFILALFISLTIYIYPNLITKTIFRYNCAHNNIRIVQVLNGKIGLECSNGNGKFSYLVSLIFLLFINITPVLVLLSLVYKRNRVN